MVRPTNGFGDFSDSGLLTKSRQILTAMTGNPHFTTPVPALSVLEQAIDDFDAELQKGEGGSFESALKNQKRDGLIAVLHSLGRYVDFEADGDEVIILSSGFPVTKKRESRPPVAPVTILKVTDGANPGEAVVRFKRDRNATGYNCQYTTDPMGAGSVWQSQHGTTSKMVVGNLEGGKTYWFRIVTLGRKGQQAMSDPVKRVVQ